MKIVAFSDCHGAHRDLDLSAFDDADLVICAGDISYQGERETIRDFAEWSLQLPGVKVFVPGNHDKCFDISMSQFDERARGMLEDYADWLYLDERVVTVQGLRIYGSPWVPNLPRWAFHDRGRDRFANAPLDVDIVVTHGPAQGTLDAFDTAMQPKGPDEYRDGAALHVGSRYLEQYLARARCWRPVLHIHGHVHESHGYKGDTWNVATMDEDYKLTHPPTVIYWS